MATLMVLSLFSSFFLCCSLCLFVCFLFVCLFLFFVCLFLCLSSLYLFPLSFFVAYFLYFLWTRPQHSLTIVTLYTNLGDDGIIHGISETEVSSVICSFETYGKWDVPFLAYLRTGGVIYVFYLGIYLGGGGGGGGQVQGPDPPPQ